MKNRHETRKGIVYKNRHHAKLLVDEIEVEEALTEALNLDWHMPEINWDELAEIAEMQDFAQRGLRVF
tara:strand:+ start:466 stop:669 length:204 start_codon:yes stop_codon:yes gene_type:complete